MASLKLFFYYIKTRKQQVLFRQGGGGRDRMVVGFTATCAITAYHR